jgi:hypothetical protein
LDREDAFGDEPVGLTMDACRRLSIGRLHQAEQLAGAPSTQYFR